MIFFVKRGIFSCIDCCVCLLLEVRIDRLFGLLWVGSSEVGEWDEQQNNNK